MVQEAEVKEESAIVLGNQLEALRKARGAGRLDISAATGIKVRDIGLAEGGFPMSRLHVDQIMYALEDIRPFTDQERGQLMAALGETFAGEVLPMHGVNPVMRAMRGEGWDNGHGIAAHSTNVHDSDLSFTQSENRRQGAKAVVLIKDEAELTPLSRKLRELRERKFATVEEAGTAIANAKGGGRPRWTKVVMRWENNIVSMGWTPFEILRNSETYAVSDPEYDELMGLLRAEQRKQRDAKKAQTVAGI